MESTEPSFARFWALDPDVHFLNHGSFGSTPRSVLEAQSALRALIERQPVRFLVRELERRLDEAREALAAFVGADAADVAFVPNATTGVNTVLRSLALGPGDEIITTNHEYNACRNAVDAVAAAAGARVVVASIPYPIDAAERAVEAVLACVTPRTRLVLIDHVTSQTALVLPVGRLVEALAARGVDALIDGAHAPGMLPLDVSKLGAAYYTGNCHKWICAPKGAAFLYVRRDKQRGIRPLVVSHGANSPRTDRSRFLIELDWTGTHDPTAYLCVPEAIRFMDSLLPGGFAEVMKRNREKALWARELLAKGLGAALPCPDDMIGSMATIPLPDGAPGASRSPLYMDPLQDVLLDTYSIEVPIIPWPAPPRRLLRVSAQLYNTPGDYEALGRALSAALPAEKGAPH